VRDHKHAPGQWSIVHKIKKPLSISLLVVLQSSRVSVLLDTPILAGIAATALPGYSAIGFLHFLEGPL
jgi:hypothetical protein